MGQKKRNLIDLILYSFGQSGDGAGLSMKSSRDEAFKLVYFYGGASTVMIGGKPYQTAAGDTFVAFPYVEFEISGDDSLLYAWVEFSGFEVSALLNRIDVSISSPVLHNMGIDGFEQNFKLPEDNDKTYAVYRRGAMLIYLLTFYIEKFPSRAVETEGYVIKARRIIEENYNSHEFGVKQLVEELKINRSYLYRLFKDELGISVIEYIISRRMARAEVLLSNARLSIKDVAYSCGFSDQMYFSRVFKKLNGRTPTQFREKIFSQNRENQA